MRRLEEMEEKNMEEIRNQCTEVEPNTEFEFSANSVPAVINSNVEELKAWIGKVKESYVERPVTYENRIEAKDDLAALRKLRKAIDSKVSGMKKDILIPFETFKDLVSEACRPLDVLIASLDKGLKDVEEVRRTAKKNEVEMTVLEALKDVPEEVKEIVSGYDNPSWLNAGTTTNQIRKELDSIVNQTASTLEAIKGSKFEAQLLARFKDTWSYMEVVNLKKKLEEQEAELARLNAIRREKEAAEKAEAAKKTEEAALKPSIDVPVKTTADDVLMCHTIIIGTKEELIQGMAAFGTKGGVILRVDELKTATMEKIVKSGYQIKEGKED